MKYQSILESNLDTREKLILALRNGFLGEFTLRGIGRIFNITESRVKQIEKLAFQKLYGKTKTVSTATIIEK